MPDVEVVAARAYLTDPAYSKLRNAKVFNLCRHYRYQSNGYYVTLLAEARGHRPRPNASEIQGFRSVNIARETGEELSELIQHSLHPLRSNRFDLSIYFGRNLAAKYARLSLRLFNLFPAPLLRASFEKSEGEWELRKVSPIPFSEIPESHRPFVLEAAQSYFERKRWSSGSKKKRYRYSMAILNNPEDKDKPSNDRAIEKFIKAAGQYGIEAESITKQDYGTLGEYDALFIRETTSVNHHTFRFANRAESLGMVVIDDPKSILRCSNKVYLAELLERYKIPAPLTRIVHKDNIDAVMHEVGLPCVVKQPDSAFSLGVKKAETAQEYHDLIDKFLARSDLAIVQGFTPSDFDWRIGILNRRPLYACRYFMARKHWQIVSRDGEEKDFGKVETLPVEAAPRAIVNAALKAANAIGDGLYGVDLKEINKKPIVIEVNDNPNIDSGYEDKILGPELYRRIMEVFAHRLELGRQWHPNS